jgi:hypothetical protein
MKTQLTEHETLRREAWVRAWVHTAQASNCTNPKSCTTFADACLQDYDERFKPPRPPTSLPIQD